MPRQGNDEFDYVVVGAGTAGCVIANRLAADHGFRVAVLEAGGSDMTPWIRVPVGFVRTGPDANWGYRAEPDASRGGKIEDWPAGRVLGGSSSINATGWIRGAPADLDAWPSDDVVRWDHAALVPYMRRSERFHGPTGRTRGTRGKISIDYVGVRHPLVDQFIDAAQAAGHKLREDINDAEADGVGLLQVAQRHGWRSSTSTAYLAPARRHRKVTLRKGVTVGRILIRDGRAVGVEYRRNGELHQVHAAREVVVCAGAVGTPKLLMLSGIGPADHLQQHNIPVMLDLKGVGSGLQEHIRVPISYGSKLPTLNQELTAWGFLKHGADFVFRGKGAATTPPVSAVALASMGEPVGGADFQLMFSPFAVTAKESADEEGFHGYQDVEIPEDARMSASVWLNKPRSRGQVRLRSSDPAERPVIDHQAFLDVRDLQDLVTGVRALREIFRYEPLAGSIREELSPGLEVQSDEALAEYVRANAAVGHHPVGTCRMGTDDEAVVDPRLRVRGLQALRLVDASVLPTLVSGGTYPTVVTVAERAADLIAG